MASTFLFGTTSILQIQSRRNLKLYTKFYVLNFTRSFTLNRSGYKRSENDYDKNKLNNKNINVNQFQLSNIPFQVEINQNSIDSNKKLQDIGRSESDSKNHAEFFSQSNRTKIKNLLNSIVELVEEVTHMDEARKAYDKVMDIKDKLKETGDNKRKILAELNRIRDDIQKLHSDMRLVNRGSENHIQLLDFELECLRKEKQKQDEFRAIDQIESILFNELTSAINDSHEKEKIHTHSIRMWGYIQAVAAAILTLFFSFMGYYNYHTKFGLLFIKFEEKLNTTIKFEIGTLKEDMNMKFQEMEQNIIKRYEDLKQNQESWGSYFKRHGTSVYRFFWPKKQ